MMTEREAVTCGNDRPNECSQMPWRLQAGGDGSGATKRFLPERPP